VKITQRLPLRIRLDEKPGLPQLRAGLSATVDIDTGHRRKVLGLSL
jgi:membrane fusion protein (multidrug efflux system)